MKKLTREEVIDALIDDDMDTTNAIDGQGYLYLILRNGVKGYDNYTSKELEQEYNERLNPEYKISVVK